MQKYLTLEIVLELLAAFILITPTQSTNGSAAFAFILLFMVIWHGFKRASIKKLGLKIRHCPCEQDVSPQCGSRSVISSEREHVYICALRASWP